MYAVTRRYTFDPASRSRISRAIRESFTPFISRATGFVAYYWIETGPGSGVSLTVFEDEARAHVSSQLAAGFVMAEIGDLLGEPEISEGRVAAHAER